MAHPESLLAHIAQQIREGKISNEPPPHETKPSINSRLENATKREEPSAGTPAWLTAQRERLKSAASTLVKYNKPGPRSANYVGSITGGAAEEPAKEVKREKTAVGDGLDTG